MAKKKQKTTKLAKATEVEEFKKGDLVGAKVKGYPLWPGRIEKIECINNKRKYTVRFFGTNDSSDSFSEILPYEQCLAKFKACSTKRLKEAIELSKSEYQSLQTIQRNHDDTVVEEASPKANHSTVSSPSVQNEASPVPKDDGERKDEETKDEEKSVEEPHEEEEELVQKPKREPEEEPIAEPIQKPTEKQVEKPRKEKKIKVEVRKGGERGAKVVENKVGVKKMKKKKKKKVVKKEMKKEMIVTEKKSQEQSEGSVEIKMEIDLPDATTASIATIKSQSLTVASPPSQSDDQSERSSPSKHQLSLESKNDPPIIQPITDPKSEGENVMISKAAMQTTIAKLKEKVAEKIREKEKRKSELRERKLHKKISIKLEVFNKKLQRFSIISGKISIARSVGRDDIGEWNQAAQAFHSVLPALAKCINTVKDIGLKTSNLTQCRNCHETLRKISSSIKLSEKNNSVPMDIRKELNGCKRCIKNHVEIKRFIKKDFENLEKGMIERKENDA